MTGDLPPLDRTRARLFDAAAERYDRARPSYPAELIDAVVGPDADGLDVLDVACGTGIASRLLAARRARVLGVELNPSMAAVARHHGVEVELAPFEAWDPAGRRFDVVTCAQAWHWLDPEVSGPKAASVLRPGGRLCLFWNVGHHPDALADQLAAVYRRVLPPDGPRPVVGYVADRAGVPAADFGLVADGLRTVRAFDEPRTATFTWHRPYRRDQWLDQLATHSDHLALEPARRDELLAAVGAAVDRFGGGFDMAYTTVLVSAGRR